MPVEGGGGGDRGYGPGVPRGYAAASGTKPAPKVKDRSGVMALQKGQAGRKSLTPDSGYSVSNK